jgi:hypothetical protein
MARAMNKTEQMREWTKWIVSLRARDKIEIIFLSGPEGRADMVADISVLLAIC